MRINVYAEELTDRIEIVEKTIGDTTFVGVRIYLELPVTVGSEQVRGPFLAEPCGDGTSAITLWSKGDMRELLRKAERALGAHFTKVRVRT